MFVQTSILKNGLVKKILTLPLKLPILLSILIIYYYI